MATLPAMPGRRSDDKVKVFDEELVFEDPPSKEKEATALKKLLEHPERWAKVAWYPGKTTAYNRARTLTKSPPLGGRWEFWGGPNEDETEGGSNLHAKYLGPPEGTPAPSRNGSDAEAQRRAAAAANAD